MVFGGGSSSVLRNAFHADGRQHVRLVEDVDLVAPRHRRVGHALAQVADVVDRVVRRGVHLDDVEARRAVDRAARLARPVRRRRGALDAVQAGGEDLRHRRLARPPRADEQVRVVHLVLLDRVRQRAHDVLLSDHVGERARSVSAVQRCHRNRVYGAWLAPVKSGPCTLRRDGLSGAATTHRLQLGNPNAPVGNRLRLLPSGPDLVHGPTPHGTRSSTPRAAR